MLSTILKHASELLSLKFRLIYCLKWFDSFL
jgi:hypothetical protein